MDHRCPLCAYSSDSITLLHVHCVSAHPKEFFTCPWCTVPFATLRGLQKHATNCSALQKNEPREGEINTVLVNNDKCLVCEGRFDSIEAAIKHYKEQHLNFSYICDVCEMYFQHNANLDVHYATCHAKSSSSAQIEQTNHNLNPNNKRTAETAFNGTGTISVAIPSNRTLNACVGNFGTAGVGHLSARMLTMHKRKSMQFAKKLYCLDCAMNFLDSHEIRSHFAHQHGWKIHMCSHCNNAYSNYPNMCRHQKQCRASLQSIETKQIASISTEENRQCDAIEIPAHVVAPRKTFGCHLCEFETTSREMAAEHLIGHLQPTTDHVKSENPMEIGVTSSTSANGIKQELIDNWSALNNGVRPEPTNGGFLDLTLDDD